ncbi:MAG: DEAD/DEAH box helicase, partial [Clostridia bacterium]|nr:DEAD/DEAH box helicase [Clostridia bacterium]
GVLVYPSRDFVFENVTSVSHENSHERIQVLYRVLKGDYDAVVTVPDAVMQYTMPPEELSRLVLTVKVGNVYDVPALCAALEAGGFVRSDLVEGPGQYAVHGGVLDVFSVQYPNPVRIDFFGDEVDSIGFFDRYTQRRVESAKECEILPCSEFVLGPETRERLSEEIGVLLQGEISMEKYRTRLEEDRENLLSGGTVSYPDRFVPLIYPERFCLPYAMKNSLQVLFDSKRLTDRAEGFYGETAGVCESLAERGLMRLKTGLPLCDADGFCTCFRSASVIVDSFRRTGTRFQAKTQCALSALPLNPVQERRNPVSDAVRPFVESGQTVAVLASGEFAASSLVRLLLEAGVPCVEKPSRLYEGMVNVFPETGEGIREGFSVPDAQFALFVEETDTFDYTSPRKRKSSAQTEKIRSYTDLTDGDLVVHVNHGIGRFSGIQTMTAAGVTRDFIKLIYADGGILYVPCEQMDLVSRYIGSDNAKLNKLGGSEWKRAKIRAKTSASAIAKDLIRLYAERRATDGYPFPADDEFQTVFESEFEYEETEGQIQSSAEVKQDMEQPYPMDRLLCGDVGFGKTEVALRAIFKCVFAGKQAAVLVPTTILALQHYQTITARFRNYPVDVGMVSRFVGKTQQKQTLDRLADGRLNVIIGTH